MSLDYPRELAKRGHLITIGYETLDAPGRLFSEAHVKLQRVQVAPTDDVESQMEHLAHHIDDPGRRRLLEKGFELVHGHFGTRVLHGAAWLKRGVPMVVSLYGYDASRLVEDRRWIHRYRWACARGAVFVALCRDMARRLIDHGIPEASVRVIHLGIDLPCRRFDPAPAPARRRFVFVGRLTPKKAPNVLVSALARLRDQHAMTADLDILGSGPLEAPLRERSQTETKTGTKASTSRRERRFSIGRCLRGCTLVPSRRSSRAGGERATSKRTSHDYRVADGQALLMLALGPHGQ